MRHLCVVSARVLSCMWPRSLLQLVNLTASLSCRFELYVAM